MLTPAFELSQDAQYLIITIKAPYAKVSETEIYIQDNEFKFYSKPYYLRLNLPGNIVEDGREQAKYEAENGTFTIRAAKETPGDNFEGLDLLTKLLAPSSKPAVKQPIIEVLGDTDGGPDGMEENEDKEEEEEFDWQIEQQPFEDAGLPVGSPKYGFASQKSGVLSRLQTELVGIVDLTDADTVPAGFRTKYRMAEESSKFDDSHYLCDLYEDEEIQRLLNFKPPWLDQFTQMKNGMSLDKIVVFSEAEKERMRNLPRKEYLIDDDVLPGVYLGLVDIIMAYAYNYRTTEGENTVESCWSICKLSATLSWLEVFSNLRDTVLTGIRRSLCYPLYRHWDLAMTVVRDTHMLFALGKRRLVQCLLEVHKLLCESDPYYVLNDLYITDYCVWIQSASDKQLSSLVKCMSEQKFEKGDVGFDLPELELAAKMVTQEETELEAKISSLKISQTDSRTPGEGCCNCGGLENSLAKLSVSESQSAESATRGQHCETSADSLDDQVECQNTGTKTKTGTLRDATKCRCVCRNKLKMSQTESNKDKEEVKSGHITDTSEVSQSETDSDSDTDSDSSTDSSLSSIQESDGEEIHKVSPESEKLDQTHEKDVVNYKQTCDEQTRGQTGK